MSKVKLILVWILMSCITNTIQALQVEDEEINIIQESFEDNLDSLLNLYYMQQGNTLEDDFTELPLNDTIFQYLPDSIYISRLMALKSGVPLTYNQIVRRYIEMYTQRKKDKVQRMIGLAQYYFPLFDDIFDYYGLPNELKYMSIIESALNPRARSRTRAVGIWQFMYGTAKLYGLTMNGLVDERRDPIKATHAAAQFSKDLYEVFKDWQLVIAAYNCGPGNVSKAIRRSGGKRNFWDIYPYLPRETRGHVPAFIAAVYAMNYYKEHNITPIQNGFPLKVDTINIQKDLHLAQVAEVLNISIDLLRDLNPQYIADIIPGKGNSGYSLILPVEYISRFIDQSEYIYAYKDSMFLNPKNFIKDPVSKKYAYQRKGKIKPPAGYKVIVYHVKRGDNLGSIAQIYNCKVNDLLEWNNLYSSRIREGQKLQILVPIKKIDVSTNTSNPKPKIQNVESSNTQRELSKKNNEGNFVYYIVKEGDTLWEIARKYPGITLQEIREWNNLSSNAKIYPGQQLRIKTM